MKYCIFALALFSMPSFSYFDGSGAGAISSTVLVADLPSDAGAIRLKDLRPQRILVTDLACEARNSASPDENGGHEYCLNETITGKLVLVLGYTEPTMTPGQEAEQEITVSYQALGLNQDADQVSHSSLKAILNKLKVKATSATIPSEEVVQDPFHPCGYSDLPSCPADQPTRATRTSVVRVKVTFK